MHRLHTLGGPNGFANMVNNRAEIVGLAETNAQDRNCPLRQFQPVVWKHGKPYALPTVGDSYGVAAYINDKGQIAGSSGACAPFNFNTLLYMSEDHAMLWVEDGTPHDLGNLGGAGGIAGNHACAINNRTQVVGHSELLNNTTFHGPKKTACRILARSLTTMPASHLASMTTGRSLARPLDANFNSHAYIWQNGMITDLNTLIKWRLQLVFSSPNPSTIEARSLAMGRQIRGNFTVSWRSQMTAVLIPAQISETRLPCSDRCSLTKLASSYDSNCHVDIMLGSRVKRSALGSVDLR